MDRPERIAVARAPIVAGTTTAESMTASGSVSPVRLSQETDDEVVVKRIRRTLPPTSIRYTLRSRQQWTARAPAYDDFDRLAIPRLALRVSSSPAPAGG